MVENPNNETLARRIAGLKREKRAVILAHYYTRPEVQGIADFLGDSLALSVKARETDADIILFAGVRFMAETAKVLSPDRKVLLPVPEADCSLAASCDAADLALFKAAHPGCRVVSYVNTSVGVKALTDICCTSSNALDVVRSIPADEPKSERKFRIFVNRIYTGIEFVQPALSDYVRYVSHTPSEAGFEAFTLTVRCDSDRDSFTVAVKGSDGLELSQTGSKDNLTLSFDIPENGGEERTLSIWINGADTGKSVKQEGKPVIEPLMVEWSEGYLTVKDGAYTFADPQERGLYFKYKSRYGFALEDPIGSSSQYPGVAYGPEETTIAYDDIPSADVDPCSLVAPAGTWRMPSAEEWEDLLAKTVADNATKSLQYGDLTIYLTPAGMWTTKVMSATSTYAWTTTPHDSKENMYKYLMWMSSGPKIGTGTSQDNAMMVRCVRNK